MIMKNYSKFNLNPFQLIFITGLLIVLLIAILVSHGCEKIEYNNQNVISTSTLESNSKVNPYVDTYDEPNYVVRIEGLASWYDYSLKGEAPGDEWSKTHDTCATRGWNRYGKLRVTNPSNGKSVICYVNDDGPRDCEYRYKYKLDPPGECVERLIDLSSHAFSQIANLDAGLVSVIVEQDLETFPK